MPRTTKKSNLAAARARMYHDLVFECAERVFAEQGFNESSMQDVAAEAGISLKTLYATFPGKDDVYRAIVAKRGAALLAAMHGTTSEGSALERLSAGVHAVVAYLVEHRPFFQILLQEGHAWGLNPRGDAARASWRSGTDLMAQIVRLGIEEGVFLDADPELVGPTVNAVLQTQLAGLLDSTSDPDPEELAERILVPMRRLLCGDSGEVETADASRKRAARA